MNGKTILSRETLIPAGVVTAIMMSAIAGTVWANSRFLSLSHEVRLTNTKLEELGEKIDIIASREVTRREFALWTRLLEAKNQGKITVPEPNLTPKD